MGKIAFVFAGQGAQYPGMGREVYDASAKVRSCLDKLEKIRPGTLKACFEPEAGEQLMTRTTQPCLYAVDLACAMYAEEMGIGPDAVAGFSLGEIPAAAFAGVYGAEDGFRLVIERAERMQACAEKTPGCMYAVLRLTSSDVEALCAGVKGVYPVNYNTNDQTVVAMAADAETAFLMALKSAGARAVKLKVGGAFHTPFMREAADALKAYLGHMALAAPRMALYSNVTGALYGTDVAGLLSEQAASPVRWQAAVEAMIQSGVDTFVEVGAGSVLTGLIKKINANVLAVNVQDVESLKDAISKGVGA